MSTVDPMQKKIINLPLGKTTCFYGVNATLLIGEIGREKEKTIITRRNYHCEQ
jgi:hypothetical protein